MEENEEVSTYEEVDTEGFGIGDYVFFGSAGLAFCLIVGFVFKQIRRTFKNFHLKVGDKIELGIETQEESK